MEWHLAATLSAAWVSFCARVDAHSHAASGLMDLVNLSPVTIKDGHPGNTDEAFFRDASKSPSPGTEVHLIVATTLARSNVTGHGTVHGHDNFTRSFLLHFHGEVVTSSAAHAHEAVGFFKRGCNVKILSISNVKPLEFIGSLATKAFLEPSFAGLADGHLLGVREGSLPVDGWMDGLIE
jgi:hypothetical protein